MTVDNRGSEVNPDHQLEDLELHQGLQAEIKTHFTCGQFGHFAKDCPEDISAGKV